MPTYSYQAKQGPAQVTEGTIQAATQDEAVEQLLKAGLVPMSVAIKLDGQTLAAARREDVALSAKERRLFVRQLTSLIRAKLELVPAITILKDQSPSRAVRTLLGDLERHMRDGNPFSEALARHPRVFSPLFRSAIAAGEAAGKLEDILLKLVEFDQQQEELNSRVKSALAYPVLLLVVGVGCLGFFVWGIVPRMEGLFAQLGGSLPWPTRVLIDLSHWLAHGWRWLLAAAVVAPLLVRRLLRLPTIALAIERISMRLPFSRDVLEARRVGRFTRTLQLLLQSGLPVFQAMEAACPTLTSPILEARLREAQEHVKRGEAIAESLRSAQCFPPLVTQMVAVGESAGTLVDVLDELASYYERSLDEMLRIGTSLIEPLMIIVMGGLVGFCVLAMVLPVFQMTRLVH